MLTENQKIMREIHNEDMDFESCLDGYEVFMFLKDEAFLDDSTKSMLWQCSSLSRTFYGEGFIDQSSEKLSDEDSELNAMMDSIIASFLAASITYNRGDTHLEPATLLKNNIHEAFLKNHEIDLDDDEIYNLLSGLIDCETIAAWVLVCELPGGEDETNIRPGSIF